MTQKQSIDSIKLKGLISDFNSHAPKDQQIVRTNISDGKLVIHTTQSKLGNIKPWIFRTGKETIDFLERETNYWNKGYGVAIKIFNQIESIKSMELSELMSSELEILEEAFRKIDSNFNHAEKRLHVHGYNINKDTSRQIKL